MCGIYGYSLGDMSLDGVGFLSRTLVDQQHRGPDGAGFSTSVDESAGIAMTRLRIRAHLEEPSPIPLNEHVHASYNGEVYQDRHGNVPTGGKSEVVEILENRVVDGMFAIAKLDSETSQIELERDPFGIKPLFVRQADKNLAFASELAPLIKQMGKVRLRREAIHQFLIFGRPLDGKGFYEDIQPVAPGASYRVNRGQLDLASQTNIGKWIAGSTRQEIPTDEEVRTAVRNAIEKTLVSNRRIGVAASGGLDSTIVCAELSAMGVEDIDIVSVRTEGSKDGILHLENLGLKTNAWRTWRLHQRVLRPMQFPQELGKAIPILGEPTRMTSVPLYHRLARQAASAEIVVLLLGEGADEMFYGYRSYFAVKEGASLSDFVCRRTNLDAIQQLLPSNSIAKANHTLEAFIHNLPGSTKWQKLRALDFVHCLEPLLRRADHLLMSQSIEGRTPFLHGDVPQVAFDIPFEELVQDQTKLTLRRAYQDMLPQHFVTEVKRPFRAPILSWFQNELHEWLQREFARGATLLECLGLRRSGLAFVLKGILSGNVRMANLAYYIVTLLVWIDWLVDIEALDEPELLAAHRKCRAS